MPSSAPGTGTARNRNYLACRSPHKSEASLAGVRRFLGIVSGADRFQKDVSLRSQGGGSIIARGVFHIPPTHFSRVIPKDRHRVPTKMETTRWPKCRLLVRRRSGTFSFGTFWK